MGVTFHRRRERGQCYGCKAPSPYATYCAACAKTRNKQARATYRARKVKP